MKITLTKIKKVKELEFILPSQGVYLITGLNGSGKTSLLAALYRIGSRHAFQKYYKTSLFESKLDSFENSKITYEINEKEVTYRYGGQRWRPTPSRYSELFTEFPYTSVKFVEANGKRVEPFADEIRFRSVLSVPVEVRDFMSYILNDTKWSNLKYVNTRRGVGSKAYLVPYRKDGQTHYYSEKNFSLGELCVLRLACSLSNIEDNSLILIDEIEMALHPQAQVRLLEKVEEISSSKRLTTLFSTHSATLIKRISRKNIIFLQEESPRVFKSKTNVYPAQVLGEIAFDDETNADFIFFVEDKQAKNLLEQMLGYYSSITNNDRAFMPLYRVVPIGGFVQVIELLNSSSQIFPRYVKRFSFLDKDVQTESLATARREGNQTLLSLFDRSGDRIKYLPCTPECGVVEMIEGASPQLKNKLNTLFPGAIIDIGRIIASREYNNLNKANIRDKSKDRLKYIVASIQNSTGGELIEIYRAFYKEYCVQKYENAIPDIKRLFGPVFNAR
ncbi:AAA family ATPase [Escherichia coli]|uniref:AAA family ATPase n=1 Tax=Escherichia coli TaxID=562 RepID=UPI000E21155D|nr:AAA family ATPase [Escherichia coli]MDN0844638.1 ATP-binding protein [Escherichia coli]HEC4503176.1 AAA family ATPase [Escherichia coli]